jgi:hypothetical protein
VGNGEIKTPVCRKLDRLSCNLREGINVLLAAITELASKLAH